MARQDRGNLRRPGPVRLASIEPEVMGTNCSKDDLPLPIASRFSGLPAGSFPRLRRPG